MDLLNFSTRCVLIIIFFFIEMSEMKSRASLLVINKVLRNRGGRKKGTQEEVVSIVEVGNLEIKFSIQNY